jgi:FkbM family methyltransferase
MQKSFFGNILNCLPAISNQHNRNSDIYQILEIYTKNIVNSSNLKDELKGEIEFGNFGKIYFPYYKMGAIDTLDLFGLDELIIFSFYYNNKSKYKKVADIGANLGLHSVLMSKCGWDVTSYEPDPVHASLLLKNAKLNDVSNKIKLNQMAVSDAVGDLEFIRVIGNTTGSHLAGAKENPYGELEKFNVEVESILNIMNKVDFIKMDVEGQEKKILCATTKESWANVEMMVEIGTEENAKEIYNHLSSININIFSQKLGWGKVEKLTDLPTSHREGSVFITKNNAMIW